MAISDDGRVRTKDDEKEEKYQDLARDIRKMWGVKKDKGNTHSSGGSGEKLIPLRLKENPRTIGVDTPIELIQRCVLLASARILLEM